MRKIKIAQIGVNRYSHAPEIFHTLSIQNDLFELVGYTLVEDERETCKEKIPAIFDGFREMTLEEILENPEIEAVAVETDEIHLLKYAQMAADHGKHIHMEKPGSQNLAAFEKLIETMRKSGKVLHIGYMYRYNPMISETLRRVKAGELGDIYSVEADMSRLDSPEIRKWFATFKGGTMFYLGCHLIDLVMQIQGVPSEVLPLNSSTHAEDIHTEDYAFAVLRYPAATSFVRVCGKGIGAFMRRQLVIVGQKGTIEIKPLEIPLNWEHKRYMHITRMAEAYPTEDGTDPTWINTESEPFQRYEAMLSAFAAMVRGEIQNPNTLDYDLSLFKTVLKCCGVEQ